MDRDDRRDWVLPPRQGRFSGLDLEYLNRDDPDERHFLILAEHPELHDAIEEDLDEITVDGHPMNPQLHISMHELVVNQIWDEDPPETWATAQRLTALGYDRHEVLHMLGRVAMGEIHRMMTEQQPFDHARFVAGLDALPGAWEAERPGGPTSPGSEQPPLNRAARRAAARGRRRHPRGH